MKKGRKAIRGAVLGLSIQFLLCGMAVPAWAAAGAATASSEQAQQMIRGVFETYRENALADPARQKEVTPEDTTVAYEDESGEIQEAQMPVCTIELDGHRMRYIMDIIGEPDENGKYPLYITLHGGGGGTEESNNQQWLDMTGYYRSSVQNGIYIACRGMEDVWNLHFLDESFPMYDRLIEDMILFKNADPDRVYLLGFSAGGDGVYGVAPRMADRFAAVNMSSGHPNGISLLNTANLPFEIQVGIRDFYSEDALRCVRGAEFEDILNGYHEKYGFGYTHRVLVHVPNGHNYNDCEGGAGDSCVLIDPAQFAKRAVAENWVEKFLDVYTADGNVDDVSSLSYAYPDEGFNEKLSALITDDLAMEVSYDTDANAVTYVSAFTRNPVPDQLVWDLSTRASSRKDTGFYWLQADFSVNRGVITASFDKETNTVTVTPDEEVNGDFSILVNPLLFDMSRPVTVVTPEGQYTVNVEPDEALIKSSIEETGDTGLAYAAVIRYSELSGK